MRARNQSVQIRQMVLAALLMAIIAVMGFTPIGYIKIGPLLEITFLMIPVAIGAVSMGKGWGTFLGGVFGMTSFIQCFTVSPFGAALLGINPVYTFIVCMVPRLLVGFLSGLIFEALSKVDKTRIVSFAVATASAALVNTVGFISLLVLFFANTEAVGDPVNLITTTLIVNSILELVVCCIVGTALGKTLTHFIPNLRNKK